MLGGFPHRSIIQIVAIRLKIDEVNTLVFEPLPQSIVFVDFVKEPRVQQSLFRLRRYARYCLVKIEVKIGRAHV